MLPCYFHRSCWGIFLTTFFPFGQSYRVICVQIITTAVSILSCYLHRSYRGRVCFFNIFYPSQKLPCYLYMSYQLYCVYITMLFYTWVTGVYFSINFFLGQITVVLVCNLSGHGVYIIMLFAKKLQRHVFNNYPRFKSYHIVWSWAMYTKITTLIWLKRPATLFCSLPIIFHEYKFPVTLDQIFRFKWVNVL